MSSPVCRSALATLVVCLAAPAAHARTAGPHAGRIIEAAGARLEFVVDTSRRARVYVLDAAGAPTAPGKIVVSLRANFKSGVKALTMRPTTGGINGGRESVNHFISAAPLPAPDGYEIVLSVRNGRKAGNVRIRLILDACGGCGLAEYACTCDH